MFQLLKRIVTIISIIWLIEFTEIKANDFWWLSHFKWSYLTPYPARDQQTNPTNQVGCRLVYVFGFFRHGTRSLIQEELDTLPDVANKARLACIERMKYGNPNQIPPRYCKPYEIPKEYEVEGQLLPAGERQLESIGMRLKKIIKPDPLDIDVRTSSKQRAKDSAVHFFRGFNPNKQSNNKIDEKIVQFYLSIPNNEVQYDFLESDVWKETLAEVSKLLGFSITTKDLFGIFNACTLGKGNNLTDEMLMWCSMIPKSTLDAILYNNDALQYWFMEAFPKNMSDPLFNLFQSNLNKLSQQVKSGETIKPKVTLLFGHLSGIKHLIRRLRFYQQNEPLNSKNYATFVNNRGLNLTSIAPLAANIQLRVHLCNDKQLYFEPFLNEISMLQNTPCEGKTSFGCPANTFSSILL